MAKKQSFGKNRKAGKGKEPWATPSDSTNINHPEIGDPRIGAPDNAASPQGEEAMAENDGMVTLTKRNVQKNGIVTYAREGVNASVYFNKSMFNGEAPDTISIGALNLRQPGEGGVGGGRSVSPEKLAERAQKAQANAEKAAARAQKAIEKANKLKAKVASVQAPEGETVNA